MKIFGMIALKKILGRWVKICVNLSNVMVDGSFLLIGLKDLFTRSIILIEVQQVEVMTLIFKMTAIIFLETQLF